MSLFCYSWKRIHTLVPFPETPKRFEVLSGLRTANKSSFGQGFVTMHDRYLFVPFSRDGGGGERGSSGFTSYEISNPRAPVVAFSSLDSTGHSTEAAGNFAGDLREPRGCHPQPLVWHPGGGFAVPVTAYRREVSERGLSSVRRIPPAQRRRRRSSNAPAMPSKPEVGSGIAARAAIWLAL